ncbi:MAG TPA: 50S ribosomal protein L10 [Patescibacteria group bacterium]|nr:50S ribosomal protein L10 [Patescibacteria group bacterium]
MPSQRNVHGLAEIKHHLATAKAVILANYAGLSVADQTTLRAKLSAAGGEFLVAKNNLLKIALKEKLGDLPRELEDVLNGPTAVIFAESDAVTTAKALAEFIKDKDKSLPEIKLGLLDGQILSVKDIETLSQLPSREQLLATLLAQLAAPAQALVRQINTPAQLLVYALEAIARH